MPFFFPFLVCVYSRSYSDLFNLGILNFHDAAAFWRRGGGWYSMIPFTLMTFDLHLWRIFLYYSYDSHFHSPFSLVYLFGALLSKRVNRLCFLQCSIYLTFSFWEIYLTLSSHFLLKFLFVYLIFWLFFHDIMFFDGSDIFFCLIS